MFVMNVESWNIFCDDFRPFIALKNFHKKKNARCEYAFKV